jgi:hypothetical protein
LCARSEQCVTTATRVEQKDFDVCRRQQIGSLFGPLDQADCVAIEIFPEPRIKPLLGIMEPKKIKVV